MSKQWSTTLLSVALSIPTQSMDGWSLETYSRIPQNKVSTSTAGMLVKVSQSASPIVFALKGKEKIVGFKLLGEFKGLPKLADVSRQGETGADDFPLRLGLIVPGDKKLTGIKKLFAPQWVKRLYEQVPKNYGLGHIHFFNVTQNSAQLGKSRKHPKSDLIQEEFFAFAEKSGPFSYAYDLKSPIEALAIWISIDGDDTKSTYEVLLSKIEFITAFGEKVKNQ